MSQQIDPQKMTEKVKSDYDFIAKELRLKIKKSGMLILKL